jgi:hypothetical protein
MGSKIFRNCRKFSDLRFSVGTNEPWITQQEIPHNLAFMDFQTYKDKSWWGFIWNENESPACKKLLALFGIYVTQRIRARVIQVMVMFPVWDCSLFSNMLWWGTPNKYNNNDRVSSGLYNNKCSVWLILNHWLTMGQS